MHVKNILSLCVNEVSLVKRNSFLRIIKVTLQSMKLDLFREHSIESHDFMKFIWSLIIR